MITPAEIRRFASSHHFTVTVYARKITGLPAIMPPIETLCVPGVSGVRTAANAVAMIIS